MPSWSGSPRASTPRRAIPRGARLQGQLDRPAALEARQGRPPPHVVQAHETGTAEMLCEPRPGHAAVADSGGRRDAAVGYLAPIEAPFRCRGPAARAALQRATPVLYYNRDALAARQAGAAENLVPDARGAGGAGGSRPGVRLDDGVALVGAAGEHERLARPALRHAAQRHGRRRCAARLQHPPDGAPDLDAGLLAQSGYFTYWGRGDEAEARFAAGDCALLTSSSASYGWLAGGGFELGGAPLPYYDDFDDAPQNTLLGGFRAVGACRPAPGGVPRRGGFFAFLAGPRCQAAWASEHRRPAADPGRLQLPVKAGVLSPPTRTYEVAVRQLLGTCRPGDSRGIRLERLPEDPRHHRRGARGGVAGQEERARRAQRRGERGNCSSSRLREVNPMAGGEPAPAALGE